MVPEMEFTVAFSSNNPVRLDRSVKYGETDLMNFVFTNRDGGKMKIMSGYKLIITFKKNNFTDTVLLRKEYDLDYTFFIAKITPTEIRSFGGDGCYWYDAWLESKNTPDYEEPLVFGRYEITYVSKKEYV